MGETSPLSSMLVAGTTLYLIGGLIYRDADDRGNKAQKYLQGAVYNRVETMTAHAALSI